MAEASAVGRERRGGVEVREGGGDARWRRVGRIRKEVKRKSQAAGKKKKKRERKERKKRKRKKEKTKKERKKKKREKNSFFFGYFWNWRKKCF